LADSGKGALHLEWKKMVRSEPFGDLVECWPLIQDVVQTYT
jgi:hypothetical protein